MRVNLPGVRVNSQGFLRPGPPVAANDALTAVGLIEIRGQHGVAMKARLDARVLHAGTASYLDTAAITQQFVARLCPRHEQHPQHGASSHRPFLFW